MNCFLDNIRLPAITANRNVKCMGNILVINILVMNCFLDNIRLPAITANRNVKCMGNIIYQ